jgi:APA family basic amino acid/polyamine antiporter
LVELRRKLGLFAAVAVVVGDMLGSGVFFTPGELAAFASSSRHVYLLWALCGAITLCGALTLAELTAIFPQPGASYHIIREGFGPFWGFLKIWVEMFVSGPGAVAGIAIVLGEFAVRVLGGNPLYWGAATILFFAIINLSGVQWGGRTQILLTAFKVLALLALVIGSLVYARPALAATSMESISFFRFMGLGIAVVLFTYDGWIDVSHVAGEIVRPEKNLPRALGYGVLSITLIYLLVNYAFLRVVPLDAMRAEPRLVATHVSEATFGNAGSSFLNAAILISILGALGGLVLTLPRLFFAAAVRYKEHRFFKMLSFVLTSTSVPAGSIIYCSIVSILILFFFQSFSRIVNFFVLPVQVVNILLISAIFRFHKKEKSEFRLPGYPWIPCVYILVLAAFLVSVILYHPIDCLWGIALTATGIPVYLHVRKKEAV